ncbi:MAG: hypothetical protein DRI86_02115 [Bacteroidetes bacterium]|nr:MAG: hypothetical protein DRI86_02115 [Bacteroidota bacterium]
MNKLETHRFSSKNILFFMGLFLLIWVVSCKKHEVYPIEPVIEYKDFIKIDNGTSIDNKGFLIINFTDGDGDIGLETEDTLPPYNINGDYYYNCLIDYFELENDSFVKIDLPFTFNVRVPYIEEDLANRGIKGEVQVEVYFNNINSSNDSIRFEVQLIDRALHKSNIITTPSIYVKKHL